ncbi:hypothetical protein MRB53_035558 [Persea americana]|uniref:Uncharacterized protein n=1 Tax=Persea americana TaxID=3435 RepID=A0ACC2K4Z8_PERAE|nr:hypothetical protein MRB53_035558 [Persea americana]
MSLRCQNQIADLLVSKDKHSRKGLQEMVQRRKKLLKYLQRTEWDSNCFVLSKLGLRDNPDYKNLEAVIYELVSKSIPHIICR